MMMMVMVVMMPMGQILRPFHGSCGLRRREQEADGNGQECEEGFHNG